jgi:hypothetical protein
MRPYSFIGPAHLLENAATATTGETISSAAHAAEWIRRHTEDAVPGGLIPATFIITATGGTLRLASRRSEHVHCALGQAVLSSGEMFLRLAPGGVRVEQVTNQSTGYAPEPSSWPAVAAALDALGIAHPGGFDPSFDFRRCPRCRQLCLVKDGDFTCAVCGTGLPAEWNAGDQVIFPIT